MEHDIALRVLGPVEVPASRARTSSQPPQQRLLLGMLALRAGHPVPVAELIDAVWDDQPPRSVRGSLQALVTGARRVLAAVPGSRLDRCGEAYRLQVEPGRVDVHRFRSLAATGREAADRRAAVATFDQALALWRGPALADVPCTATVAAARSMLAEERLSVIQDRVAGLLASGMERQAAAELPGLLAEYPLAERLAGLLIVALYRLGQRDGALRVFRVIAGRLNSELAVEPGPELQALHRRVLAGDPDLAAASQPAAVAGPLDDGAPAWRGAHDGARVVPRQLPAIPPHFAGRTEELKALNELVSHATDGDGRGAVWVLAGPAGVGKTTLAVYWAHRVADHFPGGQLYVNLRGFGPEGKPVTAAEALRGLLRAMGVLSAQIPESPDAQAALYRSMLAGKRMLVLIDNAADAAQVRPLLPGPGCAVLVTSRSQLTGLVATEGAQPVFLDVMSEAEACELLVGRLGAQRVMAEPAAATELAGLCAGLPLALSIAAARAAARPGFTLAALAAELHSDEGRLDALGTDDAGANVREVLSWSYRQLSGPAARMFRLLGVHQGPDISAPAAASLAGVMVPQARRALAELTGAHLLAEYAPGRFGFHDLLRAYASELASADGAAAERDPATRRVLDHYLITANTAYPLLYPARDPLALGEAEPGTVPERVTSRAQARAWFAAEHQALLVAAAQAAAAGLDARAWQLATAMTEFLDREGHWHDLAVTQGSALVVAGRLGDRLGLAHAHHGLALVCMRLRSYDEARAHLERAIEAFVHLGDGASEARSRVFLGTACAEQGRHAAARRHTEHALRLYRDLGHRAGQAHSLHRLGWYAAAAGDYQAALGCCGQALALHRELGNALGEAHTWDHLGYVKDHLGQHDDAVGCYRRALVLLREVSDRSEQASVLTRLGDAHRALGDSPAARDAWQQALAVLDDLHHPDAAQVVSRLDDLAAAL
jgi:DNA-binding SARP family transcriptional activator/tetratricopeptide (TPR) repeat protein